MGDANEKKSHGFAVFLIILLVIGACVFGFVKCTQSERSNGVIVDGNGTVQGNTDGNKHWLKRSANNGDVIINVDLDLAAFGCKFTVLPQTDIANLKITINFLDVNENILASMDKSLGNVREGVQVSSSVSLFDLGLSVSLKTVYSSIAVTGGTVSYFA